MTIVAKLKNLIDTIIMYIYLEYYTYKLRTDTRFMIKEAIKYRTDLRENR